MSSIIPSVRATDALNFPAPSGTEVKTNQCDSSGGPKGCNSDGPSVSSYPILVYNNYTYWPLSYNDNRDSFAIVITSGLTTDIIDTIEASGSRYIDTIEVFSGNETVNFIGNLFLAASVPWDNLTIEASTSALSIPLSSSTRDSTTLPSSTGRSPLSSGAIAGIAIGSFFGLVFICLVVFFVFRSARKQPPGPRPRSAPNRPSSPTISNINERRPYLPSTDGSLSGGSNPSEVGLGMPQSDADRRRERN